MRFAVRRLGSPEAYSVMATATDYLPEAVGAYLRLPRHWADTRPIENGKTSLFRRVKPQIDEEPDRGGPRAVLADDVLRFSVQAWDPKDREWRDEWDSGSPQRTGGALIPPRVRIAITVKDEQGRERTWSTQSRLQLATPLDF